MILSGRVMYLDVIYRTRDVDQVVDFTTKVIQNILDSQAKCKNISNRKNFCPFMDKELSELVKTKKIKYKLWLNSRNATTWLDYKRAKQNVKRVQKIKKQQYIAANVKEARSSKDLWRTTKTTLGWNKSSNIKQVEVDSKLVVDKQEIAENFNDYYIDKIKKINEDIPATEQDPLQYTRDTVSKFNGKIPEMNFRRVHLKKIRKTIGALRNTTSTSHDDICTMAIKKLAWHIAPMLKRIIILSFETPSGRWPALSLFLREREDRPSYLATDQLPFSPPCPKSWKVLWWNSCTLISKETYLLLPEER